MTQSKSILAPYLSRLADIEPLRWTGRVSEVVGVSILSDGPEAAVGDFCEIHAAEGRRIRTQVVGFRDGRVVSIPLEEPDGVTLGDTVVARREDARVPVGQGLLGRVIDGFGRPIDGGPPVHPEAFYDLYADAPGPMQRRHITEPLQTGVRVIDGLIPCGVGQRVGIFGGSGVGKSTLLAAMSRNNSADVNVIALIGERNREVRAFLDHELGEEGMRKSVVVVATSDRPAPLRVRACFLALAVAEFFRDQGRQVLTVMDSVTRLAMAQREIGLATGEPPSQKGYTPSVFSLLPKIFERAGNFDTGSITGFFTVLVEGDDMNEPIADAVRGILDGHTVLSRELAAVGHYPSIDIEHSVSRLSHKISSTEQIEIAAKIRESWSTYRRAQDLIQLGAYSKGSDPAVDSSIRVHDAIVSFLRQGPESSSAEETLGSMQKIGSALA